VLAARSLGEAAERSTDVVADACSLMRQGRDIDDESHGW
jgi:hypothetical protein